MLRRASALGARVLSTAAAALVTSSAATRICEWEIFTLGHPAATEAVMDAVLVGLFDVRYLEGENPNIGRKGLASVCYFRPHFGRGSVCRLAACRQALRGWRRLDPPLSRLPLPWPVVAMIANMLMVMGCYECALICLLCFFTYFRPSEPFKLMSEHVVPPILLAGAGHQHWALTLHPYELHRPSKTQEYDESILLDRADSAFLGPLLFRLAQARGRGLPLFVVTQKQFGASFREACLRLGLDQGNLPTPYQLRHAGASWEFAAGVRTLAEIQRRGRWRASASVRRYEKGGRVTEQLNRLSPRLRSHAIACGHSIVDTVCFRRSPLDGP